MNTELCNICGKPVDVSTKLVDACQHVYTLNDVYIEGPLHPECFLQASSENGVTVGGLEHNIDNNAHFLWPPNSSDQFAAYREFMNLLREQVARLPYGVDDGELENMPSEELNKEYAKIFFERTMRDWTEERSELEEQLAGEIARRTTPTDEQFDGVYKL